MSKQVIVFGPTGNIASVAAKTAQEKGAKVYLAMRDTSKQIPGLSSEQEKQGGYVRIQADMTKPNTVSAAVQQSRAKHAFIYVAHGSKDHMKSTLEALKSSGVEFVVFLSSFTIDKPIREIPPEEVIPYLHAQVEIQLEEVYGLGNFVAVRPGAFATNSLNWKWQKPISSQSTLHIYGPSFKMDCITPGDMGRVSGSILAEGARDGEHIVYLYGPEPLTQKEMAGVIAQAFGNNDLNVVGQTSEKRSEEMRAAGLSKLLIDYMVKRLSDDAAQAAPRTRYEEGVRNVEKYTGRSSMGFREWVESNKELYA